MRSTSGGASNAKRSGGFVPMSSVGMPKRFAGNDLQQAEPDDRRQDGALEELGKSRGGQGHGRMIERYRARKTFGGPSVKLESPAWRRSRARPGFGPRPSPRETRLGAAELAGRVAENLRAQRKRRAISLDELAQLTGVSRAALSQIEMLIVEPHHQRVVEDRLRAGDRLRRSDRRDPRRAGGAAAGRSPAPAVGGRKIREPAPHARLGDCAGRDVAAAPGRTDDSFLWPLTRQNCGSLSGVFSTTSAIPSPCPGRLGGFVDQQAARRRQTRLSAGQPHKPIVHRTSPIVTPQFEVPDLQINFLSKPAP